MISYNTFQVIVQILLGDWLAFTLSVHTAVCLSDCLSVCPTVFVFLSVCLTICFSVSIYVFQAIYLSVSIPLCLFILLSNLQNMFVYWSKSFHLAVLTPISKVVTHLRNQRGNWFYFRLVSTSLSVYLASCLSTSLSVYLAVCLLLCLFI